MSETRSRRRSLGGAHSNPTTQAAEASEHLHKIQSYIDRDDREIVHVTPSQIKKNFNARFIPCSLETFARIEWPELSLTVDEAQELYPKILDKEQFFTSLSDNERDDFIKFLSGVHSTATSMVEQLQIQPITLERESPESVEYFIVDGERRSISALYARGKIPVVKAYVYNRRLSSLERALIKDRANTSVALSVNEIIVSKHAIYAAHDQAKDMTVRELGDLLGYKKDIAAKLKQIFQHAEMDKIVERARREKLGWRELDMLIKNGVNFIIPEAEQKTETPSSKPIKKEGRGGYQDPNISSLQERISEHVGFPCSISYRQEGKKVKLAFATTLDSFEDLLSSLQRLDITKVLDK